MLDFFSLTYAHVRHGIRFPHWQALSGEKNVDKYAAHYTKQEEENFALFNYVNELSYEVEVLNEAVQRVQDDIGNLKIVFNNQKQCRSSR